MSELTAMGFTRGDVLTLARFFAELANVDAEVAKRRSEEAEKKEQFARGLNEDLAQRMREAPGTPAQGVREMEGVSGRLGGGVTETRGPGVRDEVERLQRRMREAEESLGRRIREVAEQPESPSPASSHESPLIVSLRERDSLWAPIPEIDPGPSLADRYSAREREHARRLKRESRAYDSAWLILEPIFELVRTLKPHGNGRAWASVRALRRGFEAEVEDEGVIGFELGGILDGASVTVEIPWDVSLNAEGDLERRVPVDPWARLSLLFYLLVLEPRFPFARCHYCGRIYARDRRSQKYCARECLVNERLERPEEKERRRTYMRDYKRDRRAEAKAKEARRRGKGRK